MSALATFPDCALMRPLTLTKWGVAGRRVPITALSGLYPTSLEVVTQPSVYEPAGAPEG
jgi:hypothetical protein